MAEDAAFLEVGGWGGWGDVGLMFEQAKVNLVVRRAPR